MVAKKITPESLSIIFTGGGSGGHVVPAMTIIQHLKEFGVSDISYIGSIDGIERKLALENNLNYYPIATGKLRRYASIENFVDIFKVLKGILQSFLLFLGPLKKSHIVFSTGGFVAVPAVIAGKCLGKRIYLHEQTSRVGLANKISSYFADQIFVSFEDSLQFFPKEKTIVTGYPLRKEMLNHSLSRVEFQGLNLKQIPKPLLYITGGGNGAKIINDLIKENLNKLLEKYTIIHQVGAQFFEEFKTLKSPGYHPVAFIGAELPDVMKAAHIVISRAGAGSVSELIALQKKALFIPLKIAQRNEQFYNAQEAAKQIQSLVVSEDDAKSTDLIELLDRLEKIEISSPAQFQKDSTEVIAKYILC